MIAPYARADEERKFKNWRKLREERDGRVGRRGSIFALSLRLLKVKHDRLFMKVARPAFFIIPSAVISFSISLPSEKEQCCGELPNVENYLNECLPTCV